MNHSLKVGLKQKKDHFGILFMLSNIPAGAANFVVDPIYQNLILNGDNLADANFKKGELKISIDTDDKTLSLRSSDSSQCQRSDSLSGRSLKGSRFELQTWHESDSLGDLKCRHRTPNTIV